MRHPNTTNQTRHLYSISTPSMRPSVGVFFLCVIMSIAVLGVTLLCPIVQVTGKTISPAVAMDDVLVLVPKSDYEVGECVIFDADEKKILTYILGKSGDVVIVEDDGRVIVNNRMLDASFDIVASYDGSSYKYPYTVPEGQYFTVAILVNSYGNDVAAVGLTAVEQLIGKVGACVWPMKHIGVGFHLKEVEA